MNTVITYQEERTDLKDLLLIPSTQSSPAEILRLGLQKRKLFACDCNTVWNEIHLKELCAVEDRRFRAPQMLWYLKKCIYIPVKENEWNSIWLKISKKHTSRHTFSPKIKKYTVSSESGWGKNSFSGVWKGPGFILEAHNRGINYSGAIRQTAATGSPPYPEDSVAQDRSQRCSAAQKYSACNRHKLSQIIVQFLNLNKFNKY